MNLSGGVGYIPTGRKSVSKWPQARALFHFSTVLTIKQWHSYIKPSCAAVAVCQEILYWFHRNTKSINQCEKNRAAKDREDFEDSLPTVFASCKIILVVSGQFFSPPISANLYQQRQMPTLNPKADYMWLSSIYTFDVKMMMLKFLHGFNGVDLHLDKSLFKA